MAIYGRFSPPACSHWSARPGYRLGLLVPVGLGQKAVWQHLLKKYSRSTENGVDASCGCIESLDVPWVVIVRVSHRDFKDWSRVPCDETLVSGRLRLVLMSFSAPLSHHLVVYRGGHP